MKYLSYFAIGFLVFYLVDVFSISFGKALGAGPVEIGIIVSSISMLSGILVICTLIITDAIKSKQKI